ncbi:MAG: pyridoxamine 5'-phosphate oxidase family protein [Dehalococcoidia bacterium]
MTVELTDEMVSALSSAFDDHAPCIVGTASGSGAPDVSYRGSVFAFDREHLAFWERAKGETLRNIEENSNVVVLYRNSATRQGWRFYGVAQILKDGELRQQIMERVHPLELAQDPDRTGYAVLMRIDRVRARSETIMERGEER